MTSNVGAKQISDFNKPLGFSTKDTESRLEEKKEAILKKALKNTFRPEFLNRIDQTVVFKPLQKRTISKIVKLELKSLQNRLVEKNYNVVYDNSIIKYIVEEGYDEKFGARPIKRAIQNKIEDFISENILKGEILEDVHYSLSVDNDNKVTITTI